jgi:type IV secretion system protein VirB6
MEVDWTEFFRCDMLALLSLFPMPEGFGMAADDAAFFCHTRAFLLSTIFDQAGEAGELIARAVAALSTGIVTIWVLWQGFMVISGSSREPFAALLVKTGKLVFILALINLTLTRTNEITATVLSIQDLITQAVVGTNGASVRTMIDINLAIAQTINQMIGSLVGGGQAGVQANQLTNTAGLLGQSGPAMVTATLVMLAEISIAFALMLTPLFLLFLFFQTTSSLFWSWAKFLLGVFFSLAALALVSGVVLSITATYGSAVALAIFLNAGETGNIDISGSSMRLAALGALMSVLVMSVPPMIMQFFNAGVGFAAGAMGGMLGGAMAGRMAGGGTGVPGMAYGGGGLAGSGASALGYNGASGGAGAGAGAYAGAGAGGQSTVVQQLSGPAAGPSEAGSMPAGSHGVASPNNVNARVSAIHNDQFGTRREEFSGVGNASGGYTDARIIETGTAHQGRDPTLSAVDNHTLAQHPQLGRGGYLPLSGGGQAPSSPSAAAHGSSSVSSPADTQMGSAPVAAPAPSAGAAVPAATQQPAGGVTQAAAPSRPSFEPNSYGTRPRPDRS